MSIKHRVLLAWYTVIVSWRMFSGRWFIFRDMPLWYVAYVASEDDTCASNEHDEDAAMLIAAAKQELKSRTDQAERKHSAEDKINALNLNGK